MASIRCWRLNDVSISGARGGAVLALPRIEGTLSWTSVPTLTPRFTRLRIHAPELEVALLDGRRRLDRGHRHRSEGKRRRRQSGSRLAAGPAAAADPRCARAPARRARGSCARARCSRTPTFSWSRASVRHRFGLRLAPPPAFAAPVDLRGDFRPPAIRPQVRLPALEWRAVRTGRLRRSGAAQPVGPCADRRASRQRRAARLGTHRRMRTWSVPRPTSR